MSWINDACVAGARKGAACQEAGLSIRTFQRWTRPVGSPGTQSLPVRADQRPHAVRPAPANKLCEHERRAIIRVCNAPEYASLPPGQIVPRLADQGRYLASESTFYRVLRAENLQHHRGRARAPRPARQPTTHHAVKPNTVWSWDISYLPGPVRGQFYYLYLIEDIYSRYIVGHEVHESESGDEAAALIQRAVMSQRCWRKPLVLHADNGSPMRSQTLQTKLYDLGITASHSRPRVSNDNPYSEALFRTLKYCPQWPIAGFADLDAARQWVAEFVTWYNHEHRHSRIQYVTPAQRHRQADVALLEKRDALYRQARAQRPERWASNTRNWSAVGAVSLNPDRDTRQLETMAA